MNNLSQKDLELLFLNARTQNAWLDKDVGDELLRQMYDIAKMGPTSTNCQPMRLVFLRSQEAKNRLLPALLEGNISKVQQAPVVALIAQDCYFYEHLPKIWFREGAKETFEANIEMATTTAFRNSSLQGAYLMIAARALGLEVGAMSGFDADKVNKEFFPEGNYKINFICAFGYGDHSQLFERQPRLSFDEVAKII